MDQIIVFVWVVSEYSYIQQISIEKFVKTFNKNFFFLIYLILD